MKHLPPSTQLEYTRLLKRMHQLERQKVIKTKKELPKKTTIVVNGKGAVPKARPSPIKAPPPPLTEQNQQLTTTVTKTLVTSDEPENVETEAGIAGRVTLKERLKSLTSEQRKMLFDGQQRKVANKRFKTVSGLEHLSKKNGSSFIGRGQEYQLIEFLAISGKHSGNRWSRFSAPSRKRWTQIVDRFGCIWSCSD